VLSICNSNPMVFNFQFFWQISNNFSFFFFFLEVTFYELIFCWTSIISMVSEIIYPNERCGSQLKGPSNIHMQTFYHSNKTVSTFPRGRPLLILEPTPLAFHPWAHDPQIRGGIWEQAFPYSYKALVEISWCIWRAPYYICQHTS
jgi:hypothetical protein